jgi:hypothetical protein
MLKLLEFYYTTEYKKESKNSVADALSRKIEYSAPQQCVPILALIPTWMKEVIQSYENDKKNARSSYRNYPLTLPVTKIILYNLVF